MGSGADPTISAVIATYQSARTLGECLASLRHQDYPAERVELLVADGSSTDGTPDIARRFGATVLTIPPDRQSAEYNKGVAVRRASGDLLLLLDHDNVLPHPKWLRNLVRPLVEDSAIVGSQPLRFHYRRSLPLLDRYCALVGAVDPVVLALGRSDHLPWDRGNYLSWGPVKDCGAYFRVAIEPRRIPTLGANGFLVRRTLLLRHARLDDGPYLHIDVNADLIRAGKNVYAFTKDTIEHRTGYANLRRFLGRRKLFLEQFVVRSGVPRRYRTYTPGRDTPRLLWFIATSLTGVVPTFRALRGFARIPDPAWFLHPALSVALLGIYGWVIVKSVLSPAGTRRT